MIKQTIQKDQIVAMKAKDPFKVQTLRYILAQIKNKEIDQQVELSDGDVVNLIRKESKKLQESMTLYKDAGRQDLVDEDQKQFDIITSYLPKEISDMELKEKIKEIIDANADLFQKNPNAMIGLCVGKLKSIADSSRIAEMVRSWS